MLQRSQTTPALHVLVATPSATMGQGGVDRVMATLKMQLDQEAHVAINVRFLPTRGSGSVLFSPLYTAWFCLEMLKARWAGKLDAVHINVASYGSTYRKLVVARAARFLGIPYVLHLHGAEYQTFWPQKGLLSNWIRQMFEHASQVIVLGRAWKKYIAGRAPASAGRIEIVPNAAPRPSLAWQGGGDKVHILFLGQVGERKGVPQLISALNCMRESGSWRATLAGDGEVEATRHRIDELGLSDRVDLPGWVGPEQVGELIASADILVLPSFAENLPVSVVEGMAAGLAVVATPVGAVEDIIVDGETGLLVPPGDVDALANALSKLVLDPALRARLGANALAVHRQQLDLGPFVQAICGAWIRAAQKQGSWRKHDLAG